MQNSLSVPALLRFLGPEAAQAVLAEFPVPERETMALDAAVVAPVSEEMTETTVAVLAHHLTARDLLAHTGVARARETLGQCLDDDEVDTILDRVSTLASLPRSVTSVIGGSDGERFERVSCVTIGRALGYLPSEHAGRLMVRLYDRAGGVAMAMDSMGLIDHLAAALRTVRPLERDALLGLVAKDDQALAARLRGRLAELEALLNLDEGELVDVLAEVAIEELALALIAADTEVRSRCMNALDGARRAMLRAEFERSDPVQLWEVEEARRRVSGVLSHVFEARLDGRSDDWPEQALGAVN